MTTLDVCITCRDGEGGRLHDRLAGLLAADEERAVELRAARCLANCEHGCSASLAAAGKWSYLLGGLTPDLAPDLLTYARSFAASASGVVMPSRRPASLATIVHGRIPPLAQQEPS